MQPSDFIDTDFPVYKRNTTRKLTDPYDIYKMQSAHSIYRLCCYEALSR